MAELLHSSLLALLLCLFFFIINMILFSLHAHPVVHHDQYKSHRRVREPSEQVAWDAADGRDVSLTVEKWKWHHDQEKHEQKDDQPCPFKMLVK